MSRFNEETGKRIAALRKQHNLTQEDLAEKLNISVKHLGCSERGVSSLSIDLFIELCEIFDTSLDYLIRGIDNSATESLPSFLIEFLKNTDEQELPMFFEYVKMYQKIRNLPKSDADASEKE